MTDTDVRLKIRELLRYLVASKCQPEQVALAVAREMELFARAHRTEFIQELERIDNSGCFLKETAQ